MKRVWSGAAPIIKGVVSDSFTASPLRKIFGRHHCFELYCFAFVHSLDTPLNRLLAMLHSFELRTACYITHNFRPAIWPFPLLSVTMQLFIVISYLCPCLIAIVISFQTHSSVQIYVRPVCLIGNL